MLPMPQVLLQLSFQTCLLRIQKACDYGVCLAACEIQPLHCMLPDYATVGLGPPGQSKPLVPGKYSCCLLVFCPLLFVLL